MSRAGGIFDKLLQQNLRFRRVQQILFVEKTHWKWMPLVSVIAIALILRWYQISTESIWVDELNSYEDAIKMESGNLGVRPLYYLLLNVWMRGGQSDAWLRGLSVLLDLGAISVTYLLGQYAINRRVAFLTGMMMALSPLMINHAQEIRTYPLITFLTVSGTLALAHALKRPTKLLMASWAILRLLAMFTSPLMILMLLPDSVLYGLRYWRKWPDLRRFCYGLLFVGIGWAPLVLREIFSTTKTYVAEHSTYESFSVSIPQIMAKMTAFTVYWPLVGLNELSTPIPELFYKVFTVLLVGVLLFALTKVKVSPTSGIFWVASWALLPASAQFLGSELFLSGTLFRERYFLYTVPYLMMLLAFGIERIGSWKPALVGGAAALYLLAAGGGLTQYYSQIYRNDWQGVAASIESQEKPGDAIVNFTIMADYNFPRYYSGELPVTSIHVPRTFARCTISEPQPTETSPAIAACLQDRAALVRESLDDLPSAERLWLVCYANCQRGQDYDKITKAVLGTDIRKVSSERFDALGNHDFAAVELYLLDDAQ